MGRRDAISLMEQKGRIDQDDFQTFFPPMMKKTIVFRLFETQGENKRDAPRLGRMGLTSQTGQTGRTCLTGGFLENPETSRSLFWVAFCHRFIVEKKKHKIREGKK